MSILSSPPASLARPGWLTLVIAALVTVLLGGAELALDLVGYHGDPVLADGFRLALGSTLVLLGANVSNTPLGGTPNASRTSSVASSRPADSLPPRR
jgi:hypothetical protein